MIIFPLYEFPSSKDSNFLTVLLLLLDCTGTQLQCTVVRAICQNNIPSLNVVNHMKMDRMYRYKAILLLITTSIPSYGFPVVRVVEIKANLIWINLTIFKAFALYQAVSNINRASIC